MAAACSAAVGKTADVDGVAARRRAPGSHAPRARRWRRSTDVGQLVEVGRPVAQAGALDLAGHRRGDRGANRCGELLLQRGRCLPRASSVPSGGLDRERDSQVRRELLRGRRRRSGRARRCARAARAAGRSSSGSCPGRKSREHCSRGVRHRDEIAAQLLGQRADQRGDQFLAQRRHLPGELVAAEPGQHVDRHVHGDAVVARTGLEPVAHRQREIAGAPDVRLLVVAVVARSRSSRVSVSRSGVLCRAFFHQASKCRAER